MPNDNSPILDAKQNSIPKLLCTPDHFTAITEFLTNEDLTNLATNKALTTEVKQHFRWENYLKDELLMGLQLESARVKAAIETTDVNNIFESLAKKGITCYQTLYVRYKKLCRYNQMHVPLDINQLILLSGHLPAIKEWLKVNNAAIELNRPVNPYDKYQWKVIHYLALTGNKDVLIYYKNCGFDILLQDARWTGVQHIVGLSGNRAALLACRDNLKLDMTAKDKMGAGVQHSAAWSGNRTALLTCRDDFKLDMTAKDIKDVGVQHYAVASGNRTALLTCRDDFKLDMTAKTKNGLGVQHYAGFGGNRTALLTCRDDFKLDMTVKTKNGAGVQHYAGWSGNRAALLTCRDDFKLDMTAKDEMDAGVQHYAGWSGNRAALLACRDVFKLDMTTKDKMGAGVQHFAGWGSRAALLTCRDDFKLDMTAKDETGAGVQHYAGWSGNQATLLTCRDDFKLDMTAKDNTGVGMQHYAAWSGNRAALLTCRDDFKLDMKACDHQENGIGFYAKKSADSDISNFFLTIDGFYKKLPMDFGPQWASLPDDTLIKKVSKFLFTHSQETGFFDRIYNKKELALARSMTEKIECYCKDLQVLVFYLQNYATDLISGRIRVEGQAITWRILFVINKVTAILNKNQMVNDNKEEFAVQLFAPIEVNDDYALWKKPVSVSVVALAASSSFPPPVADVKNAAGAGVSASAAAAAASAAPAATPKVTLG